MFHIIYDKEKVFGSDQEFGRKKKEGGNETFGVNEP